MRIFLSIIVWVSFHLSHKKNKKKTEKILTYYVALWLSFPSEEPILKAMENAREIVVQRIIVKFSLPAVHIEW